jgi:uncharacterized protein (DUF362 family)
MHITRRVFNRMSALAGLSFLGTSMGKAAGEKVRVAIVKSTDRGAGFSKAVELLGDIDLAEKEVYLKCNYNSPDPYPATTHPEALRAANDLIKAKGGKRITLVERSGMGETRQIWDSLKTLDALRDPGLSFLPLEELAPGDWQRRDLPGSHWDHGIEVPNFLNQKSCVVQVCNLKTHRFGGQFSASLKNSIGLIAKYSSDTSHNYMNELHASRYQCSMIAEVNQVYSPTLVLMDAIQVFIKGGPESGEVASPGIIAASRDRVAIDCVGLAILRFWGAESLAKPEVLFAHEQLRRAAELGLGIHSEAEIELVTEDKASRSIADQLEKIIKENN